ncbi:sliding clamp protein [Aeromonas phage AsFcp_4]|uniref:Sliding clamp n=1 Tax=Aeromonas phage PX29 TaxID=926067 RepID=E5DPV2_9CAUD|nr:DNA polymerase processivity factor [Aeromonas phage PX29]ADQ52738.1 gp45 sliding clamp protein [Aeromonas phage PX29]QAX98603.1 sliding clamp protein [Aeromonas phage AsFcp_2]QAX99634.1 sliding clamp protein [Aeromonas phage AsFcp_4]
MQLSKETVEILSNFAKINPSVVLKPGTFINTKSVNNVLYASATIKDQIDSELRIYSLGELIGVANMIGLPAQVTEDGEYITIKNAAGGKSMAKIKMAEAGTIIHPKKAISIPTASVVFELTEEQLKQIMKSASTMSLVDLHFVNDGRKILARLTGGDANSNTFEIPVADDYEGNDANFDFIVALGNMKMTDAKYKVMIAKEGAICFEGANASYIISLDAKSKYTA